MEGKIPSAIKKEELRTWDLPFDCRQEAQEKLIGAGFKFSSSLLNEDSHKDNPIKNDSDVDGDDTSATDEDLRPDLVLTGE